MILVRMINLQGLKFLFVLSSILLLASCSGGGGGSDDGAGFVLLNWTAPSERADETSLALSEIDSYQVYYGSEKGNYIGRILVEDGSADEAEINSIPKGKYFVVVTTVDTDGRESSYSKEVEVKL